jgi:hypothetical protein
MKLALTAAFAAVLLCAACASTAPTEADTSATIAAAREQATPAEVAEWQKLRQRYMDCATKKAESAAITDKSPSKTVANDALKACRGELDAMHDAFRGYLETSMTSSHGKTGARQAADRVKRDAEDKARDYLVRDVEYVRGMAARK